MPQMRWPRSMRAWCSNGTARRQRDRYFFTTGSPQRLWPGISKMKAAFRQNCSPILAGAFASNKLCRWPRLGRLAASCRRAPLIFGASGMNAYANSLLNKTG